MVVDAVLWHWVYIVAATEGTVDPGTEGFVQDIQWMEEYFYADNRLFVSTRSTRIQQAFNVLTETFDWVGLLTNVVKTV